MAATGTGKWTHGLFGCFDDCGLCIYTYLFPCVTFGQTAEVLGKGSCMACGAAYFIPFYNLYLIITQRGAIRELKGIPGSCFGDCLTVMFCHLCQLIQEAQEVKASPSAQSMCRE